MTSGVEALERRKAAQIIEFPLKLTDSLMNQVQILAEREGGLVECYIPTEFIDHEEVPVKEEWATDIARQMRGIAETEGGSGQQTPIQVGLIDGEEKFKIIDGFHRDAALILNGETQIYATVRNIDWNALYDSRIFTARDHAHVRFSRVVQWIQEVWEYSGLQDDMTLEQAILSYRYGLSGKKIGLSPDAVQRAATWVAQKEELWGIKAMTFYGYLDVAGKVDPHLVHSTREKKSGHKLEAPTQAILKIFAREIPERHEVQRAVMDIAQENNLKGPSVLALCRAVADLEDDAAFKVLYESNATEIQPVYSSRGKNAVLRGAHDILRKGHDVFSRAEEDIDKTKERLARTLEQPEEVSADGRQRLSEALEKIEELQRKLGDIALGIRTIFGETEENQIVVIPRFGELGKIHSTEWQKLEPHIRFALSLEHSSVKDVRFGSLKEFYVQVLNVSGLFSGTKDDITVDELKPILQRQLRLLNDPENSSNDTILFRPNTKKPYLSVAGQQYLLDRLLRIENPSLNSSPSKFLP